MQKLQCFGLDPYRILINSLLNPNRIRIQVLKSHLKMTKSQKEPQSIRRYTGLSFKKVLFCVCPYTVLYNLVYIVNHMYILSRSAEEGQERGQEGGNVVAAGSKKQETGNRSNPNFISRLTVASHQAGSVQLYCNYSTEETELLQYCTVQLGHSLVRLVKRCTSVDTLQIQQLSI